MVEYEACSKRKDYFNVSWRFIQWMHRIFEIWHVNVNLTQLICVKAIGFTNKSKENKQHNF